MLRVFLAGNLGKDAELREAGETVVCSFSVATNRKVKGEKVTTWVRCSLWGARGEGLAQYLTKGQKVAVTGELSTREYDGKFYVECRVDEVTLLGSASNGERPAAASGGGGKAGGSKRGGGYSDADYGVGERSDDYGGGDDEIPFARACFSDREPWW